MARSPRGGGRALRAVRDPPVPLRQISEERVGRGDGCHPDQARPAATAGGGEQFDIAVERNSAAVLLSTAFSVISVSALLGVATGVLTGTEGSMFQEFKKFAMRGNVVDLAVGVIIGVAFGKIVDSLVNDIIMPVIGRIFGA